MMMRKNCTIFQSTTSTTNYNSTRNLVSILLCFLCCQKVTWGLVVQQQRPQRPLSQQRQEQGDGHCRCIADELDPKQTGRVNDLVSLALGDSNGKKLERYETARLQSNALLTSRRKSSSSSLLSQKDNDDDASTWESAPSHELVYGELSIPILATILDAVGVEPGDRFLDIGSGDGALVLGAALLYPEHILTKARGIELVPGLVRRSQEHLQRLRRCCILSESTNADEHDHPLEAARLDRVSFHQGNVYDDAAEDSQLYKQLRDTTIAVCFATTWSHMNNSQENGSKAKTSLDGRRLPKLSKALTALPPGARVVIVDGRLDEKDGYRWEGDLRVYCPDTAPYSIASLYVRC